MTTLERPQAVTSATIEHLASEFPQLRTKRARAGKAAVVRVCNSITGIERTIRIGSRADLAADTIRTVAEINEIADRLRVAREQRDEVLIPNLRDAAGAVAVLADEPNEIAEAIDDLYSAGRRLVGINSIIRTLQEVRS